MSFMIIFHICMHFVVLSKCDFLVLKHYLIAIGLVLPARGKQDQEHVNGHCAVNLINTINYRIAFAFNSGGLDKSSNIYILSFPFILD